MNSLFLWILIGLSASFLVFSLFQAVEISALSSENFRTASFASAPFYTSTQNNLVQVQETEMVGGC